MFEYHVVASLKFGYHSVAFFLAPGIHDLKTGILTYILEDALRTVLRPQCKPPGKYVVPTAEVPF